MALFDLEKQRDNDLKGTSNRSPTTCDPSCLALYEEVQVTGLPLLVTLLVLHCMKKYK